MIQCAVKHTAELVIVTRDSDYGLTYDGKSFINDHLKQEFGERVSNKRTLSLYSRLSEALKHFAVPVTEAEAKEEERVASLQPQPTATSATANLARLWSSRMEEPDFYARVLELLADSGLAKGKESGQ